MSDDRPDIAVLISYGGHGGVERMVNHLITGLIAFGCRIDVLVLRRGGGHYAGLPRGAQVHHLGTVHTALAVPGLVRYLRRRRPRALLAAKDRAGRAALCARALARVPTRVYLRLGNTLSELMAGKSRLRRTLRYRPIRYWYPRADGIVAVSQGVADDVAAISGLPVERIRVIRNPAVGPDLDRLAATGLDHPWFAGDRGPVMLGVGRLTGQKDFPTLLRALARVSQRLDARLVILGEGKERGALESLARKLGVDHRLDLPGFVDNPYAWMQHADLFILSSAWEGSPNVLAEALYLGTPVVATDCRSGPREVLDDGRYGPLVPVGDDAALATAIEATLADPLPADTLREAVREYTRERSTLHYLEVMGIEPGVH